MLVEWCLAAAIGISAEIAGNSVTSVLKDERGWERSGVAFEQVECDGRAIEVEVIPSSDMPDNPDNTTGMRGKAFGFTYFTVPRRILITTEWVTVYYNFQKSGPNAPGSEVVIFNAFPRIVNHEFGHGVWDLPHTVDGVMGENEQWPTDEEVVEVKTIIAD